MSLPSKRPLWACIAKFWDFRIRPCLWVNGRGVPNMLLETDAPRTNFLGERKCNQINKSSVTKYNAVWPSFTAEKWKGAGMNFCRHSQRKLGGKRRPAICQNGRASGKRFPVITSETLPPLMSNTAAMRLCKCPSNFKRQISLANCRFIFLHGFLGLSGKPIGGVTMSVSPYVRTNQVGPEIPCFKSTTKVNLVIEASKSTRLVRFLIASIRLQPDRRLILPYIYYLSRQFLWGKVPKKTLDIVFSRYATTTCSDFGCTYILSFFGKVECY